MFRHTLLGILDWTRLHGYALRELAKGYSWIYPMTSSNIYPTLRGLEDEGFVEHTEEVHDGRLRKIYSATDEGRQELARWLGDPSDLKGTYRDPALLKICLLRDGAYEGSAAWIRDELERCREATRSTTAFLAKSGPQLPKYTRLVAEHGLDLLKLKEAWFDRLLDELAADETAAQQAPAKLAASGAD